MTHVLRPACLSEATEIPQIESQAAVLFAAFGLPEIAALPAGDGAFYLDCIAQGTLWVVATATGAAPVGFAAAAAATGRWQGACRPWN